VTGSQSKDASESHGTSDSRSITAGISSGTTWGISTSTAVGTSSSIGRTSQRSREFLVEQHELQRLPPSAVIVTYASPTGRHVVFADANPGIIALPTATLLSVEEAVSAGATAAGSMTAAEAGLRVAEPADDEPPPNLGPPPERLDWRRPR
jgi:hypothetical protein